MKSIEETNEKLKSIKNKMIKRMVLLFINFILVSGILLEIMKTLDPMSNTFILLETCTFSLVALFFALVVTFVFSYSDFTNY